MRHGRGLARRGLLVLVLGLTVSCASPPPRPSAPVADAQVVQMLSVGRRAYDQGDFAQSRALYRQALLRARAIDHAALAADAAYNLAVSEIALQNYGAADLLLREAEYDAARAATDVVEPRLLRAKVAYLRGQLPDAVALADDVLASGVVPPLRRQAAMLRGQIRAEAGELDLAREDLRFAMDPGDTPSGALAPAFAADAKKLEGTIARRGGDHATAARLFDAEADLLRAAFRYRDMGRALARAADAYLMAGRPAPAAERFFLAARSADALGDAAAAKLYLGSSIAAAALAGDHDARARAGALLDEISRRSGP